MLHWIDSQLAEWTGAGRCGITARSQRRACAALRLCPLVLAFGLFAGCSLAEAAEQSAKQSAEDAATWRLDRDRDGVRIFTRPLADSSFRAVRSTMTVPYQIAELVALVRDTEACAEWAHLCRSSQVIETISETDVYVYTHNDLPWPISDRDAVAHVVWSVDDSTGAVFMDARATAGKLPENRGIVRLTNADTSWSFTPLGDGQVEVVSEAHVDPGGPLPAWLINRMLVDAPYKTMTNLRRIVETGRYANARFNFLSPPSKEPVSNPSR